MIQIKLNLIILLLSGISGISFSCGSVEEEQSLEKHKNNKPESTEIEKIQKDLETEQRAKVYVIEKKAVVFFMVNKKEIKNLTEEIGDSYKWETESLFNDFTKQTSTFKSLLSKHNINCVLSNNKQFEIKLNNGKSVSFSREEKDQIIGEIITDGVQKPLIEFGMYSNKELAKLIEGFFKIQNLGYVPPPDTLKTETEIEPEGGL